MLPDVFDHVDFRTYLKAWFVAKKIENPRISHRWVARALGSQDPSVFLNLFSGRRRVGPERLADLIRVLALDGLDAEYFTGLVDFAQAPDRAATDRAFAAMAEVRIRARAARIETPSEFLAAWYIPAIQEMTRLSAFVDDPAWIAAHLDPPIRADEAESALALCLRLGYLGRVDGRLVPTEPTLRTDETVTATGSWAYHRDGLELATRAVRRLREGAARQFQQETAFVGTTLAIPASRIPELRRLLFETQARVAALAEPWVADADRVVQVSFAVVPVATSADPA